ncbi:MAG: hypothetical protein Ta2G_00290 [Termitinemataceae bacterium]|nr:MAG: hypothetical protein Ta2G_00290 [Termitinemataceae bacterium]
MKLTKNYTLNPPLSGRLVVMLSGFALAIVIGAFLVGCGRHGVGEVLEDSAELSIKGTVAIGRTVNAEIANVDDTSGFSYQWILLDADKNQTNIPNAKSQKYTIPNNETLIGQRLKVQATKDSFDLLSAAKIIAGTSEDSPPDDPDDPDGPPSTPGNPAPTPTPSPDDEDEVYTIADPSSANLAIKFGIITSGEPKTAKEVTRTFNAVHWYVSDSEQFDETVKDTSSVIKLGDYIDLPSLVVSGVDAYDGAINATNTDVSIESTSYGAEAFNGPHGKLLRLIVVGINIFNGKNNNSTPHVVFHFENIPGRYKMNDSADNTTGYLNSAMRKYVTGNFLTGLINAGVPDKVLWAPDRIVASRGDETPTAQTIKDKLWLPTEIEISGIGQHSVATVETADNQAIFYRPDDSIRKNGITNGYWLASPKSGRNNLFCSVNLDGDIVNVAASYTPGVVPAFCVK